jgi:multidrug efflux pump subunit AcrA (membrane-fusion protein)
MKSKKFVAVLVGILVILTAGIWFYRSTKASSAVSEKDLFPVPRVDYPQIIGAAGLLEARSSVQITPPQIAAERRFTLVRMADEGTQVNEGDFLLEFDSSSFSLRLRDAQATYQGQEEKLQQSRSNFDSQVRDNQLSLDQAINDLQKLDTKINSQAELLSANDVEIAKIQRAMAQTKVDMLQKKIKLMNESAQIQMQIDRSNLTHYRRTMEELLDTMDSLVVRAPVAGVVIYKRDFNNEPLPQPGKSFSPTNAVMELPDLSTMRVKVLVDEVDAGKVKVGQKANVTIPTLQGMQFSGTVIELSAILKQATYDRPQKIAEARVELDPGQELTLLRPGMSANVQIKVGVIPNAVVIAMSSIQERNGGSYVQVYRPDLKTFEWRQIELQTNDESSAVVRAGLDAGEKIRTKPKI